MENFINWLNEELRKRGWNRAELSRKSGLGESTLSSIYSGSRKVGKKSAQKIADALDLPESEVFRQAGIIESVTIDVALMEQMQEVMNLLTASEIKELIAIGRLKIGVKREQEIQQSLKRNNK